MIDSSKPSPLSQAQTQTLAQVDAWLAQLDETIDNDLVAAAQQLAAIAALLNDTPHPEFQRRRAQMLMHEALLDYRHMRYSQGIASANEGLAIFQSLDDISGLQRAYYMLGICHSVMSDVNISMDYILKAIAIDYDDDNVNYVTLGKSLNAAALIDIFQGYFLRAIERLEQAKRMFASIGYQRGLAIADLNLARAYVGLRQLDLALKFATSGYDQAQHVNADYVRIGAEIVMGEFYVSAEQAHLALPYFQKALSFSQGKEWLELELEAISRIGAAYAKLGELMKARAVLEAGLRVARQKQAGDIVLNILQSLVGVYEAQGDYQAALKALREVFEVRTQQIDSERSTRMASLEQTYQLRIARQETNLHRQRAEDLKQRAEQDREYFQQLNVIREEFLSAATHDLKNPLTGMRTYTYLLRMALPKDGDGVRYLDLIDYQIQRMASLISDMLELAKLEAGQALQTVSCSLVEMLSEVIGSFAPVAAERGIRIETHYGIGHEEARANLDPSLMKRAIGNLISNAIKYSPQETRVTIGLIADAERMHITIADEGIGIAPEHIPNLFKRFYRIPRPSTQAIEGTGLGLSIVKTIVDQHGGTISVSSTLGLGTHFRISLPQIPPPSEV